VEVLEVENIIVCGHTGCGAIDAVLHPERAAKLELVRAWVSHAERTRRIVEERYGHLKGEELATAAVEENVLVQLENLRTYPFVADRFTTPERRLHGWVFDIASGKVYTYDAELEDFVPLSPPPEPPAPPPV
jgi:carbonic anhydrase